MVLTGSYHSHGHIIDMQHRVNTTLDIRFMDKRRKHAGTQRTYKGKRLLGSVQLPPPEGCKNPDQILSSNQAPNNDLS